MLFHVDGILHLHARRMLLASGKSSQHAPFHTHALPLSLHTHQTSPPCSMPPSTDPEEVCCRVCFNVCCPPLQGLTDLLLQPCACMGTQAFVHLSKGKAEETNGGVRLSICSVPVQRRPPGAACTEQTAQAQWLQHWLRRCSMNGQAGCASLWQWCGARQDEEGAVAATPARGGHLGWQAFVGGSSYCNAGNWN